MVPPSTKNPAPVLNDGSSEERNSSALVISLVSPKRAIGSRGRTRGFEGRHEQYCGGLAPRVRVEVEFHLVVERDLEREKRPASQRIA